MVKVKIGLSGRINRVEQLKAVLQEKEAELARLQRVQQVLREKEQVITNLPVVVVFYDGVLMV
jgi:hypothetical protein